jgi:hypothetical protein
MSFFMSLLITFSLNAQNQSIAINGNVLGSSTPISRAVIIFIGKEDKTNKISTMTDVNSNYYINVATEDKSSEAFPFEFALEQNYPNFFSTSAANPYNQHRQEKF